MSDIAALRFTNRIRPFLKFKKCYTASRVRSAVQGFFPAAQREISLVRGLFVTRRTARTCGVKRIWIILPTLLLIAGGAWLWQASRVRQPDPVPAPPPPSTRPVFRIGLVPEHEVMAMRRSYRPLAEELSRRLNVDCRIVTLSSYAHVLHDFEAKELDAAFLGSLVALLAIERQQADPLVRPENASGVSTYRGVIFVREDSPYGDLEDCRAKRMAIVRTTMAGSVFPVSEFSRRQMLGGADEPKMVLMGTHDDVIRAVASGQVEFGAAKDLRLDAYQATPGAVKLRRLLSSPPAPNNALILRRNGDPSRGQVLRQVLLDLHKDPVGRAALESIGAVRMVPCQSSDYDALRQMIDAAGPSWEHVGVPGPAPRSATAPATRKGP